MQKYYVEVDRGTTFWHSDPECEILHRIGGPAVTCPNGAEQWWFEDQCVTREEHALLVASAIELKLKLHLYQCTSS